MHKALNNILEAKWLERIEDNLSGHNIEVSKEKKDNGKWIFICKGDEWHDYAAALGTESYRKLTEKYLFRMSHVYEKTSFILFSASGRSGTASTG